MSKLNTKPAAQRLAPKSKQAALADEAARLHQSAFGMLTTAHAFLILLKERSKRGRFTVPHAKVMLNIEGAIQFLGDAKTSSTRLREVVQELRRQAP